MTKEIDISILNHFCTNKSMITREPFIHENKTYATDGYCFIALFEKLSDFKEANFDQKRYIINYNNGFNKFDVIQWHTIDDVNPPQLEECEICHGNGRIQTGKCPYCDKGLYRPTYEIEIEGFQVNGWKVKDLVDNFTNVKFGLLDMPKGKVIKAQFDEGYAYLSAWITDDSVSCKFCVV